MVNRFALTLGLALVVILPATGRSQTNAVQSAVTLSQQVRVVPNIVYLRANGWEGRLDVYAQRSQTPTPTVIYIHGGGWVGGDKESRILNLQPFLMMGYSVVNVEYRLGNVSLAPAAIEDCRCALR
jgi:acetyl esterase/lipase